MYVSSNRTDRTQYMSIYIIILNQQKFTKVIQVLKKHTGEGDIVLYAVCQYTKLNRDGRYWRVFDHNFN